MLEKPKFRHIGNFDQTTGEIIEGGVLALIPRKKINGFGKGWFAMNQGALKAFRESNLTGRDYDILFAILEILDFDNYIQLCQEDLCQELDMKLSNVNRSVKKLVSINALIEGPKISRSRTYRLNPNFGWKGSAYSHRIALNQQKVSLAKRMEERGLKVV
jgi:hypothetical protein